MKRFFAACRFLTIIPLPQGWCGDESHLAGSFVMFPLVGVVIGLATAAVAWGASRIFPGSVAAVVVAIALLGASGGLHLDGLCDTADGFLSSRPRQRILEIMKDSHIGAMGVIVLFAVLSLKIAALAALPRGAVWRVVLLMPIVGRCAMLIVLATLPYARPEGGLGALFSRARNPKVALWGVLFLIAACLAILGWRGAVTAVASLALTALFAFYSYRKIGGATGDVFGAACELAELVPPLVILAWAGIAGGGAV